MNIIVDFLSSSSFYFLRRNSNRVVRVLFRNDDSRVERKYEKKLLDLGFEVIFIDFSSERIWDKAVKEIDEFVENESILLGIGTSYLQCLAKDSINESLARYFFIKNYFLELRYSDSCELYLMESPERKTLERDPFFKKVNWYKKRFLRVERSDGRDYISPYFPAKDGRQLLLGVLKLLAETIFPYLRFFLFFQSGEDKDVVYVTHNLEKDRSVINSCALTFSSSSTVLRYAPSTGVMINRLLNNDDLGEIFRSIYSLRYFVLNYGFVRTVKIIRILIRSLYLRRYIECKNAKVFYSDYEGIELFVARQLLKEGGVVSCCSSFSHGFNIYKSRYSHAWKAADINFTWGKCHGKIFDVANDTSFVNLVVGYLGDSDLLNASEVDIKVNSRSKVVIYDNTTYRDLYHDDFAMENFLIRSIMICLDCGSDVIIKAKFDDGKYDSLKRKFEGRLNVDTGKSSVSEALKADIVLSYGLVSPVITLLAVGKEVLAYAPFGLHDKRIIDETFNEVCANDMEQFEFKLRRLLMSQPVGSHRSKRSDLVYVQDEKSCKDRSGEIVDRIVALRKAGVKKTSVLSQIVGEYQK